jgi:hypothetical protein
MGLFDRRNQESQQATGAVLTQSLGVAYEIWGQRGWPNVDVVGESFHAREIRALLSNGGVADEGELRVPVELLHNPHNTHDRNAVEVHASTGLLGHLSRDDAARYAPVLGSLQQQGYVASTTARVWGREQQDRDTGKKDFFGSVRVDLPEPHMLFPRNQPPSASHQVLPSGSAIRVAEPEGHGQNAVAPYLTPEGECWVYATVHEIVEEGPRSTKHIAEIRIDGTVAGRLTPKMSSDMLPAAQFLAAHGLSTCVRAVVKGNQLKTELVLYTSRAHELPPEWFDALPVPPGPAAAAPSTETPPEPTGGVDTTIVAETVDAPPPPPPPPPPAGWYSDPSNAARLRLWDGSTWTDQTQP